MRFLREYGLAIVVAVLLHGVLLTWLAIGFSEVKNPFDAPPPKFITANIVKLAPQQKAQPQPKKPAQPKVDTQKQAQLEKQKAEQQKAAEKQKQAQLAKQKADQEKQALLARQKAEQAAKAEQQKQELARQKAEQDRKKRAEALLSNLPEDDAPAPESAIDEQQVASFIAIIQQAIIANWSRPPSARNGMQVLLDIQMIPNGTIINVNIAKSSGNDAFDRSAVAAVKKTERIAEMMEMDSATFERYFRHYQMLFNPEDLRL